MAEEAVTVGATPGSTARARSTVRGVVRLQILANGLGAFAVFCYFSFLLSPQAEDGLADNNLNLLAFTCYSAAMVLLALPLNTLFVRRAMNWVREGKTPTDSQRKLLFSLPLAETLTALISWIGSAILFGVINHDVQRVSLGILLAGVVTCTLLYLLLEGHFRPVYALALADADLPADRRDVLPRLMLAWLLGSAVPLISIGLIPIISPASVEGYRLTGIAAVSLIAGVVVMGLAARSVARPLNTIRDALKDIEQGDLNVYIPIDDLGELGRLAEGVNDLAAGMREQELLRELFQRQVGQAGLADLAIDQGISGTGSKREVTVLFVDLRGYTRFSESHPPEDVVAMLNRFFRVVVAEVSRAGGWVNKFEGDAALCLFGAPQDQTDHADRALRAAVSLPAALEAADDLLGAGIGVASGEVIAGFVGTPERFEYTVIGDVVNLASRLCDEAKAVPSGVLASSSTILSASQREAWVPSGRLTIRGRQEKAAVYTLRPAQKRRARRYGTPWSSKPESSAP